MLSREQRLIILSLIIALSQQKNSFVALASKPGDRGRGKGASLRGLISRLVQHMKPCVQRGRGQKTENHVVSQVRTHAQW